MNAVVRAVPGRKTERTAGGQVTTAELSGRFEARAAGGVMLTRLVSLTEGTHPFLCSFYSYRDPSTTATLEAFGGAVAWTLDGSIKGSLTFQCACACACAALVCAW